jgi:GDP-L-fucose synthase
MERILVTGSTGLVGRCFTGDKFIRATLCDLTDPIQTDNLFRSVKPDAVIHCAAKVGGLKANMTQKGDFFYQNIMMNTNVIEASRKHGVQKLVAFLSTCVFPDDVEYPLNPSKIHLGKPHFSNDAYAYAKRMADVQIQAYREQFALNYFSVVPTNIYGPGDNYDLENGHVVPTLIHKFYLAKQSGGDVKIWGTGSPLREFVYSEDVALLTERLLFNYEGSDPVIISTSQEFSIKELAETIAEIIEFEGEIVFETEKPDGQLRKPSDNSVIRSLFPDFSFTPLRAGLEKSIQWFIQNYPNVRK